MTKDKEMYFHMMKDVLTVADPKNHVFGNEDSPGAADIVTTVIANMAEGNIRWRGMEQLSCLFLICGHVLHHDFLEQIENNNEGTVPDFAEVITVLDKMVHHLREAEEETHEERNIH